MLICPICSSRDTEFFHTLNSFSYFHCKNCATLFLHPQPSTDQIHAYYKKEFVYSAGKANEIQIRKRAEKILRNLKEMNPLGKTLLDIGSGYGFFLDEAEKSGLSVFGVEPSKELTNTSINRSINTIANTTFDSFYLRNNQKSFDFIIMIHVIEHIDNPKEMIKKAVSLLSKGGVLYIETPNLDSHLFRAEKYQYTFLTPPDHIWIFSQYSFQKMFEKVKNISVGQISTYSDPVHFMGILKKKLGGKGKGFVGKIESKKIAFETSNTQPQKSNIPHIKYLLFDKLLAPIFTPILNISRYGTILELYVGKK